VLSAMQTCSFAALFGRVSLAVVVSGRLLPKEESRVNNPGHGTRVDLAITRGRPQGGRFSGCDSPVASFFPRETDLINNITRIERDSLERKFRWA
jgi:hypothetical protein